MDLSIRLARAPIVYQPHYTVVLCTRTNTKCPRWKGHLAGNIEPTMRGLGNQARESGKGHNTVDFVRYTSKNVRFVTIRNTAISYNLFRRLAAEDK